jgi:hypothetical protein
MDPKRSRKSSGSALDALAPASSDHSAILLNFVDKSTSIDFGAYVARATQTLAPPPFKEALDAMRANGVDCGHKKLTIETNFTLVTSVAARRRVVFVVVS